MSWALYFDIVVKVLLTAFLPFLYSLFYFNIVQLVEDLVVILRPEVGLVAIACLARAEILKCFVVLRIVHYTGARLESKSICGVSLDW